MKVKRGYTFFTLTAILCLFMQACFVAKNYSRPQFEGTEKLFRTDELPADSVSVASVSWRSLFTDSLLSSYIEQGLEDNLDIRIALQRLVMVKAASEQAAAGYLPSLQGRSTATHQELARNSQFGSFFDGAIEQFELSASFSWEADIWGKIRSNRRAAMASYLQQVAAHKAVKTELIAQLASNYFLLLALDQQRAITIQTIENRERSLTTIEALKKAGNLTQVAVDQAAAQVYNSKALLIDLENSIFRTENTLSFLLGKPGRQIKRGTLGEQQPRKDLSPGVPVLLLRNRADVMASEYGLVNAFELTNVARSQFYPSFTLSGTSGFQSLQLNQWIDSGSLFATIIGSITQPLFNRRQVRTDYTVATARQKESLLKFEKTLLQAGREVSNALYAYEAATRKYQYRQQEVISLRRAEINSEALLENGFGTYLDLLTARQNALNAQLNEVDNQLAQLQSMVEVYRALGGGWR